MFIFEKYVIYLFLKIKLIQTQNAHQCGVTIILFHGKSLAISCLCADIHVVKACQTFKKYIYKNRIKK